MQMGVTKKDLRREVTTRIRRVTVFLEASRNTFPVVAVLNFLGGSRSRPKQQQARGDEEGLYKASRFH